MRKRSYILEDEQVDAIRASYTGKYGEMAALAKEYGVQRHVIANIVLDKPRADTFDASLHRIAMYSDMKVAVFRRAHSKGISMPEYIRQLIQQDLAEGYVGRQNTDG